MQQKILPAAFLVVMQHVADDKPCSEHHKKCRKKYFQ
jgi:hypothetical protein